MTVAVLGLILLAAAGVLTAAVVTSNTGAVETDLWSASIHNLTLGGVFVAGMLTTVLAVAGLALMTAGMRREKRLRQERRVLRQENRRLTRRVETVDTDTTIPSTHYSEAPAQVETVEEDTTRPARRGLFPRRRQTAPDVEDTDTTDFSGPHDRVVARDKSVTTETTSAR
jgi:hypothetical protein